MAARKILDAIFLASGAGFVLGRIGFLGSNKISVESYKDLIISTAENKNLIMCNRVTINRYYIDDEASTFENKYYIRPVILLNRYYDTFYKAKADP